MRPLNICLLCAAQCAWDLALCPDCFADCPRRGVACRACGLALPEAGLCGRCAARPPPFSRLVAPFRYRYPVDALIRDFKYRDRLAAARFFGSAITAEIAAERRPLPECLLPVPLHWRRCAARGFNQSLEIARLAGRGLGVAVNCRIVRRVRATPAQAGLGAAERRRNLRGAFALAGAPPWQHVAIVDDVVTTGTTVREMSRALIRAGVGEVEVWAAARAG
jgi:ComF family protein